MEIINARIDERLVHGMVATFWLPSLNVNRVICIDEESSQNILVKNALRMATPKEIFLSVISVEKAISNIQANKYGNERVMMIAKKPDVYVKLKEAGVDLKEITMGTLGIFKKPDTYIQVNKFLLVSKENEADLEKLHELGVILSIQLIPDDVSSDFYSAMKAKNI